MSYRAYVTPKERLDSLYTQLSGPQSWEDRYRLIIEKGRSMPLYPEELRAEDFKIKGCQSQVWLNASIKDGRVYFIGDSDAAIVKGLVAIVLEIYSGLTPQEIIETQPDIFERIGLNANLSQTRVNGLAAMVRQIKFYGLAFSAIGNR
ncbi:MAG: SufE family protein [Bdellovibrionales bacterium]|nr:SufE family protein [Bdellovibrionales bacterium]